ncbi:transposase [Algoriphagus sp. H41]|uniref:Transposase n=1 Tax=Algoriphagus oliviformis TaxID=2811231 RepID=A0ABS3CAZ9_9BACT|nr:transposase [Algoriphagus oliviformis]MBN7813719.1 transposase [Algoriphagus oliviformis]
MKNGLKIRQRRTFSEALRKQIVGQLERKEMSISEVSREYEVSKAAIYTWLYRYSGTLKKGTQMVMEKDSQEKNNQELKNRIKELEAALGRKSLEADLFRVIVDLASEEYKTDLKKTFGEQASNLPAK